MVYFIFWSWVAYTAEVRAYADSTHLLVSVLVLSVAAEILRAVGGGSEDGGRCGAVLKIPGLLFAQLGQRVGIMSEK